MEKLTPDVLNFLRNNQEKVKEILKCFEVKSVDSKILNILKNENFEVLETNEFGQIEAIKKKSNGDIFRTGDTVWDKKYKTEILDIRFDAFLTGWFYNQNFYINYIRSDSGIYDLKDIDSLNRRSKKIKFNETGTQTIIK